MKDFASKLDRKSGAKKAKDIILGVTGGVSAYKACELLRVLKMLLRREL